MLLFLPACPTRRCSSWQRTCSSTETLPKAPDRSWFWAFKSWRLVQPSCWQVNTNYWTLKDSSIAVKFPTQASVRCSFKFEPFCPLLFGHWCADTAVLAPLHLLRLCVLHHVPLVALDTHHQFCLKDNRFYHHLMWTLTTTTVSAVVVIMVNVKLMALKEQCHRSIMRY